jgi:protein O-mannosyl-transferase
MNLSGLWIALKPWHAAVAAGLLAAAVAGPSVKNGFVLDDRYVIENRPMLEHPPSASAVLEEPYWPPEVGAGLWRPAVLASYALDYQVSGEAWWFHLMNVLWAGAAAAVLVLVVAGVFGPRTALIAGALFAVHPVHVEATANVIGRAELMAALGYGLALLAARAAEQRPWWLVGLVAAGAFAVGAKEHAATLPAAVLLCAGARSVVAGRPWRDAVRRAWLPAAVAVLPVGLYFVGRLGVLGTMFGAGVEAVGLEGLGSAERAWAMAPITLEWWRLLLVPIQLAADYSPAHLQPTTALTLPHVVALALCGALGAWAWRLRRRVPELFFGVAWVVVTILPTSNLLVPVSFLVAERTLFLPSLGAMVAVAAVGLRLNWPARVRVGLLAALLLAGVVRSVVRTPVWRDQDSLWASLARDAPESYVTLWVQGTQEFRAGRWGTGEQLLRRAIAIAPLRNDVRDELALWYAKAGRWRPVVTLMREEMAVDSNWPGPWALLPLALLRSGDTAAAAPLADQAARRYPDNDIVMQNALAVLVVSGGGWCNSARWVARRYWARIPPSVPIDSTELVRRCP